MSGLHVRLIQFSPTDFQRTHDEHLSSMPCLAGCCRDECQMITLRVVACATMSPLPVCRPFKHPQPSNHCERRSPNQALVVTRLIADLRSFLPAAILHLYSLLSWVSTPRTTARRSAEKGRRGVLPPASCGHTVPRRFSKVASLLLAKP